VVNLTYKSILQVCQQVSPIMADFCGGASYAADSANGVFTEF
jgi:hypothetical protein